MQTPPDAELLTDADVGRLYQIKPTTLRSLRHRRQIPFIRLGGRIVRYRRAELEQWLRERSIVTGTATRTAG